MKNYMPPTVEPLGGPNPPVQPDFFGPGLFAAAIAIVVGFAVAVLYGYAVVVAETYVVAGK
jgi:hypothetical protein